MQSRGTWLLVASVLALSSLPSPCAGFTTLRELYGHIQARGGSPTQDGVPIALDAADPQRTVGFLSQANWHSARHMLPTNAQRYIGSSTTDLVAKVIDGSLVGAMIKGVPLDPQGQLETFLSDTVTPQAVLFKPGDESATMREAVDAAIVRLLARGKAQEARRSNPPNSYMEIHTCKAQESDWGSFPFPDKTAVLGGPDSVLKRVLQTKTIRMAEYAAVARTRGCEVQCSCRSDAATLGACSGVGEVWYGSLGDSWAPAPQCCACPGGMDSNCTGGDDWAQDGDYTVTPPRGFWPDYTEALLAELRTAYHLRPPRHISIQTEIILT
jgi:hypothetical protein